MLLYCNEQGYRTPLTTLLLLFIYNAAKIAKMALKNNTTLRYEALKTGLIKEKDYERIVDSAKMIYPA